MNLHRLLLAAPIGQLHLQGGNKGGYNCAWGLQQHLQGGKQFDASNSLGRRAHLAATLGLPFTTPHLAATLGLPFTTPRFLPSQCIYDIYLGKQLGWAGRPPCLSAATTLGLAFHHPHYVGVEPGHQAGPHHLR